ncbi:LysR family transcriptional regulator [Agaribacterium sp. ZY112]|uniref:LysR family transcriptional regulator n=1 Tax=Agaribacterium sp. ZY112 TaxID=3233574 RepID=UPI003526369B
MEKQEEASHKRDNLGANYMKWNYDDIALFISIANNGSFSAAARQLNIPSSTVSRRLAQLEEALNVRLLERSSRKMKLTSAGQQLLDGAEQSVLTIREQTEALVRSQQNIEGHIHLSAPVFMAQEVLSEWLSDFALKHPSIRIQFSLDNELQDLIEEGIDLAVRIGPLRDSNYIAQFLGSSSYWLCASPKFLAKQEQTTTEQLLALPFVNFKRKHELHIKNNTGFSERLGTHTLYSSNDITVLRQAAIKGLGLCCLPDFAVNKYVAKGELVRLLSEYSIEPIRDIYAVYPSRKQQSLSTRLLIDYLKERYRSCQPIL